MKGLKQVIGYGELILCEQEKPKGSNWYDRGPCEIAKDNEFFASKMTEIEDCHVVKMRKQCIECSCNKGPVEVYWKPRTF